jgi:TRAP-type C4-dicarboxylate transport system permease small subunit
MKASLLASVDRVLHRIDAFLVFLAVLCLCGIGALTTLDVAMRYLFNSPFSFAFDLTSMYLFPASVLLILADVNRHNENIDIDLFARKLTVPQWRAASLVGGSAAFAIFAVITWLYVNKAVHAFVQNESTFGAINWPIWPAMAIAAVGFGGLALSLLTRVLQHLAGVSMRPVARELTE